MLFFESLRTLGETAYAPNEQSFLAYDASGQVVIIIGSRGRHLNDYGAIEHADGEGEEGLDTCHARRCRGLGPEVSAERRSFLDYRGFAVA